MSYGQDNSAKRPAAAAEGQQGPAHVALIGCGFTGTSAFFQLVDRFPVRHITLYEASGDFGPGYPYRSDDSPDYTLNNTTDTMCLVPSNRRAFAAWVEQNPDLTGTLDTHGLLPRSVYGRFLKDVVAATLTVAAIKNISVRLIAEEATRLTETPTGQVVITSASGNVTADAAILTTGRCPPRSDLPPPPPGSRSLYCPHHIHTDALDAVPLDATVHVLGASLSAYDVVNRLFSASTGCRFERTDGRLTFRGGPNQRTVVLCSRTGRLKKVRSQFPRALDRTAFTAAALCKRAAPNGFTLADIGRAIEADAASAGAAIDWAAVCDPYAGCASADDVTRRASELLAQAVAEAIDPAGRNVLVDLFAQAQVEIWDAFAERPLASDAEIFYRTHLESSVLSYAAPAALATAEKLLALFDAGRLRVVKGVREVAFNSDNDAYRIVHDFGIADAKILVAATGGVDRDVRSPGQPPLIRSMADQGLLHSDERDGQILKGAAVDMTTFRARGSRNVYLANMLLWGPGFFTSSAFMMATVVERLLTRLYETIATPDAERVVRNGSAAEHLAE